MTKRIFRSICLAAVAVLMTAALSVFGVLYGSLMDFQTERLEIEADAVGKGIAAGGIEYLQTLDTKNYRITLISVEGDVIFDSHSDSAGMENHLAREEINEAFENGKGESRRYSSTLSESTIYYAEKLDDGTVLRLSVPAKTAFSLFGEIAAPVCAVLIFAVLLSVFFAKRLSNAIVEPLNSVNLEKPLENEGYDEIAPLLRRIESQQRELKKQSERLLKKENELDTVIESMEEGIVLLNSKGEIISINLAAKKIFCAEGNPIGENILSVCRNLSVKEAVDLASEGRRSERNLELSEKVFRLEANPILSGEKISGTALFFFDITEKEDSEQLRREFTANVSHELKTPLHSITGFSELMVSGIMKQEDYVPCAKRIHSEAKRMTRLIEDIINLSNLDENANNMDREKIDLYSAAESVIRNLEPAANAMETELSLSGEHLTINGIPELIESIVFNLCDNAIKYNRKGGKVEVSVTKEKSEAVLRVKDTGIGIPPEHRERIFERFYRVDKSHSKEVGGTGLGLSIVKHAAKIHNAKIELESKVGEGTTISLYFNIK